MSLQDLIAHYLATNYPAVLDPFLQASGARQPDLGRPPQPDLRTLVEDYVSQSISKDLGDVEIEDEREKGSWKGWKAKDVVKMELEAGVKLSGQRRCIEGVSAANLLTVNVERLPTRHFDTSTAEYRASYAKTIITSSVDKTLKLIDYESGEVDRVLEPHKAAVLSFAVHPVNSRYILTGSMDGTTILTDLITLQPLQSFRSNKFVVHVAFSPDGVYFATASYDHNIVIYAATSPALAPQDEDEAMDETDDPNLACDPLLRYEEVHRVQVESNPEAIVFTDEWLLYTLRSSHLLHYVRLGSWEKTTKSFNPHPLDTHVSFSILNMAIHPSGKVVACQTGDRGAERVLLYGIEPEETERLACLWTGNDADDFVLPRMDWLPDGSGLITTTSNGHLSLIAMSGEVRSTIKVHGAQLLGQASSEVVRDCCVVRHGEDWEVVSVGYDRLIRISR